MICLRTTLSPRGWLIIHHRLMTKKILKNSSLMMKRRFKLASLAFKNGQLGVKSILQGRGLWPAAGLKLADSRKLLAEQPDFKEQRGRLVERMIGAGQHILMFPKYHCEFNFIENLWGRMKVFLRRNCEYDFAALQQSIPVAVASVPVQVIRRYAQRCDRFMDAYRPMENGVQLTPSQVARAVKKYTSHRCIPRDAATLFPEILA